MRRYFAPRRRVSESETPEPRFHWRTRVNSLMNEDGNNASSSNQKSKTSPVSIYPTRAATKNDETGNTNREGARFSLSAYKDDKDKPSSKVEYESQPVDYQVEERRRERFLRTNSDSRLKMRVRFSKNEYLETSKSLDAADENDDNSSSHWRERRLRRSRSKDKSGASSFDRSEGTISEDDDDYCTGACGGSFDSGLDLRGSSSPEDNDESFMNESNIQSEVKTTENTTCETSVMPEEDRRDSSFNYSTLSTDVSDQRGAIPKRQSSKHPETGPESGCDVKTDDAFPKVRGTPDKIEIRETQSKSDRLKKYFDNLMEVEKDYFRDPSPVQQAFERTPNLDSEKDRSSKEVTPPHQRPGYGFFHDDEIDGIEEIIERIISEEEAASNGKGCKFAPQNLVIDDEDLKREIADLRKDVDECNYGITDSTDIVEQEENERARHASQDNMGVRQTTVVGYPNKIAKRTDGADENENGDEDSWSCAPKILLEDIFTLLTPKARHQASQVCRQWYDLFYSPRVWETFILLERTLTKKRFNLYKGYQRELCPWKTQLCLRRVGSFFKRIVITPIADYFNLCEFLRILAAFLQYEEEHGQNAMPLLHTFDFTFACATRGVDGVMVHGTGGQILDMIVKLLIQMRGLKHLKVNQLLTDVTEVPDLFSALTSCFCESLNSLEMLNVTKVPLGLADLCHFRNLIKLTISPQHLNEEVLILLAGLNILYLHLIQDVYTCECNPVSSEAWKLLKEMAPWMRVYLEVSGTTRTQLLIQPRAPVYGVFLRTPFSQLGNDLLTELVEQYSKTLRYLVQEHLPRRHGPRSFDKRCDSSLLFLVRRCPHLHTLVVNERMSTATLVLVANEGKSLNTLLVRQNALIKRCDWPSRGEGSREFHRRLKECALNFDKCTSEVCILLRRQWRPLTDKQFMRLKIVPKVDIF